MPIDLRVLIEKSLEKEKKRIIKDIQKTIDQGAKKGAEAATRDFDRFYKKYVEQYYKYKPKRYVRNLNLRFTLVNSVVHGNTGNVTFMFSNSAYEYPPRSRTNPDMVFDAFMSGSRYSNAAVMRADPKNFGVNIIRFNAPQGSYEILKGMQNTRYLFQDFLEAIKTVYSKHLEGYIVTYFETNWQFNPTIFKV